LLWEEMWNRKNFDNLQNIIIPVLENKNNFPDQDKLSHFCDMFSKIKVEGGSYLHTGHLWSPLKMKIRKTKEFKTIEKLNSVNEFFNY
jgi:hypothetical protein